MSLTPDQIESIKFHNEEINRILSTAALPEKKISKKAKERQDIANRIASKLRERLLKNPQ